MDIQFGEMEQSQPERSRRPDQDGHFTVVEVGQVGDKELKIFVDLDVMRDMEAHSQDNTQVELGGVMLGQQHIDDQGQPFVLVTDSLRARHYHATRGSFKFTHDTWSQITLERKQFRPELEMVGWYHTHPGWSVFLSGMDLFICNHFFNRPLDVALVIDPCADQRGWFQWTTGPQPETMQTGGFYLMAHRHRQQELSYFQRLYNRESDMNHDPRYRESEFGSSHQPVVNLLDNRKPVFEIAIVALLLLQVVLVVVLGGLWLASQRQSAELSNRGRQETVGNSDNLLNERESAYQEVLSTLVDAQTGQPGLVEKYTQLKVANQQLQSNQIAQIALSEKLTQEKSRAVIELNAIQQKVGSVETQLSETRGKLQQSTVREKKAVAELKQYQDLESTDSGTAQIAPDGTLQLAWWWVALGGTILALAGSAVGYWFPGKKSSPVDGSHVGDEE